MREVLERTARLLFNFIESKTRAGNYIAFKGHPSAGGAVLAHFAHEEDAHLFTEAKRAAWVESELKELGEGG